MIIDSHAHINDEKLRDIREEIISSLNSFGIEKMVEIGFDYESSREAVELANSHKEVYAAVGIHPHDAKNRENAHYDYFRSVAENPKVVAIGEIGLDYFYDLSERDVQQQVFREQIELAEEVKLPIAIHMRDAFKDVKDILTDMKSHLSNGVLIHCYTGSAEFVKELNAFDCFYALGGAITFKNAKKEDVIRTIPLDRLLIETDSPYLTPVPYRGKPNEPKYVNLVLDKLVEVLGMDRDELGSITRENTLNIFKKMRD